jgi:hypothetical protein
MAYKNKSDQKASHRKWYLAHRAKIIARTKAWKHAHPGVDAAQARERRRLKRLNAEHDRKMAAGSIPIVYI